MLRRRTAAGASLLGLLLLLAAEVSFAEQLGAELPMELIRPAIVISVDF